MSFIGIRVPLHCRGEIHEFYLNPTDTIDLLRDEIYEATGIEPDRQIFVNLDSEYLDNSLTSIQDIEHILSDPEFTLKIGEEIVVEETISEEPHSSAGGDSEGGDDQEAQPSTRREEILQEEILGDEPQPSGSEDSERGDDQDAQAGTYREPEDHLIPQEPQTRNPEDDPIPQSSSSEKLGDDDDGYKSEEITSKKTDDDDVQPSTSKEIDKDDQKSAEPQLTTKKESQDDKVQVQTCEELQPSKKFKYDDENRDEPQPSTSKKPEDDEKSQSSSKGSKSRFKRTPPIAYLVSMIDFDPKTIGIKKLLVLDIDKTIYDVEGFQKPSAIRPHLQRFLVDVYAQYDIAIWSSTDMKTVYDKLKDLKMVDRKKYHITFCLDIEATTVIEDRVTDGICYVKSLETIWKRYPEYSKKNTILCDDYEENIYENQNNSILVQKYEYCHFETDEELLYLKTYLLQIAPSEDLSTIDHSEWRSNVNISMEEEPRSSGFCGTGFSCKK